MTEVETDPATAYVSVVCARQAVQDVSESLRLVDEAREGFEKDGRRIDPNGRVGLSEQPMRIRADRLLHALYRASRHISKLRDILSFQDTVPFHVYWLEERDVAVVAEGRRTQSSLLRAQAAAKDACNRLLTRLDDSAGNRTTATCHADILRQLQLCDRATSATAAALSSVISALAAFPAPTQGRPEGRGTSAIVTLAPPPRRRRETLPARSGGLEPAGTCERVLSGSGGGGGGGDGGQRGFGDGLRRSASASGRSLRSRAAARDLEGVFDSLEDEILPAMRDASAPPPMSTQELSSPPQPLPPQPPPPQPPQPSPQLATAKACGAVGPTPAAMRGATQRRHASAAAAVEERRRLMYRPSIAARHPGGDMLATTRTINRARDGITAGARSRTPEAEAAVVRQRAASVALMQGRASTAPRRRVREASGQAAPNGILGVGGAARAPLARRAATASAARANRPAPSPAEEAGGPADTRRLVAVNIRALEQALDEQVLATAEAAVSLAGDGNPSVASSGGRTDSPRGSDEAARARRRSLVRMHTLGADAAGSDSATSRRPRSRSIGRSALGARTPRYPTSRIGPPVLVAETPASGDRLPVDDDEAAAMLIAKQEQEAQARADELLALRLAAREEAGAERRSRRRLHRRSRRRSPSGTIDLNPELAAAWAGGAEVSDAVRALQFQDIDENDFETLLTLDERGGAEGRTCAGARGLTEEAVGSLLTPSSATADMLEDSCAICLADFELGDEVETLPCQHTFHGACIRKWLLMRNCCPTDMRPLVSESARDGRTH